jgi:hypothetical protein
VEGLRGGGGGGREGKGGGEGGGGEEERVKGGRRGYSSVKGGRSLHTFDDSLGLFGRLMGRLMGRFTQRSVFFVFVLFNFS